MKSSDSRFISDLIDPARRAAAIPKARRARAFLYGFALVFLVTLGILSAVLQLESTMVLAFGALLGAFSLYLDVLVKLLLAFEAANIGEQKKP